jgi:hypothetical protein
MQKYLGILQLYNSMIIIRNKLNLGGKCKDPRSLQDALCKSRYHELHTMYKKLLVIHMRYSECSLWFEVFGSI